jgi:hypothetical protein
MTKIPVEEREAPRVMERGLRVGLSPLVKRVRFMIQRPALADGPEQVTYVDVLPETALELVVHLMECMIAVAGEDVISAMMARMLAAVEPEGRVPS